MISSKQAYRRRGTDSGAAAVEFALVLPLLLLILFGIIDFGRAYNMQISMTQAAREGVRVLAVPQDGSLPGSAALARARTEAAAFPVTGLTITTAACPPPASVTPTTSPARVTVTRAYDYITPVSAIADLVGGSALAAPTLTGRGEMRCNG